MQKRLAHRGVVCVSVLIDREHGKQERKEALALLTRADARLLNYRVDMGRWTDCWNLHDVPQVLIFRDGKLLKAYDNHDSGLWSMKDVSKFVEAQVR